MNEEEKNKLKKIRRAKRKGMLKKSNKHNTGFIGVGDESRGTYNDHKVKK